MPRGASCILLVVLTHVCEALHLFPAMHWELENSAGHYTDLVGAILGLRLFLRDTSFRRYARAASARSWRKIPIALIIKVFGEEKAQSCEIA
jgi:hypothetical protein